MAHLVEQLISGIRIVGYSVAGEETVVAAPELNVCFDAGLAPSAMLPIDHVLLTHGHMDHAAGLAYYFSQRCFVGNAPGCVVCPKALVDPIRDLMRVWGRIEGHVSPCRIVGLDPGESFEIRKGLLAKTFALNHRVPSLGFCIVESRHKLKPELAGKTGPELVAMKKQGIEIEQHLEVPLIAYCGDTAEGAWQDSGMVQDAKVLVLECTFYEADHVTRARAGYHLHVRDVARILPKMTNEHFLLTHVSRRTSMGEAKRTLAGLLDAETMKRVTFLMDRPRKPRPAERPA